MANVGNVYLGVNGQAVDLYSAKKMYVGFNNKAVEIPLGQSKFDYKTWLASASLSATGYSSLDDVLQDELAVRKLMTIHASVDYLASWKTTDEDIVKILSNDICAKWITLRDYALDTLDREYRSLMESLGKYYYGEWALMPQVPKMTSDTAPYGEAIATSNYSSSQKYKAFDDDNSTSWTSNQTTYGVYIGYHFINPVIVRRVLIKHVTEQTTAVGEIRGSNDGTNWTKLADVNLTSPSNMNYIDVPNDTPYSYYCYYISSGTRTSGSYQGAVVALQFYAWAPKGNVPIMTSNTAPYGEAFGSSVYSSYYYYKPFDDDGANNSYWSPTSNSTNNYIGYKFVNPVCVKRFMYSIHINDLTNHPFNMKLQASNDGTNWTDLTPYKYIDSSVVTVSHAPYYINVDNDNYYLQYRIFVPEVMYSSQWGGNIFWAIQFYGRELKVSVPVMTSNTAPYGEASAKTTYSQSGYEVYKAFDGDSSTRWNNNAPSVTTAYEEYLKYDFGRPVCIKMFNVLSAYDSTYGNPLKGYAIKASNDNTNWDTLYTDTAPNSVYDFYSAINDPNNTYRYYMLESTSAETYWSGSQHDTVSISTLQFYGLDYSEYDWDTDNPRHYLYDHGVELETLDYTTCNVNSSVTKEPSQLVGKTGSSTYDAMYILSNSVINFTNYDHMIIANGNNIVIPSGYGDISVEVFSQKPTNYNTVGTYRLASVSYNSAMPMVYLDTSNVSASAFAGIGRRAPGSTYSCTEWWLE